MRWFYTPDVVGSIPTLATITDSESEMNRKSRIIGRHANSGTVSGYVKDHYEREFPSYLENEYSMVENLSPKQFYDRVIDEVEECRVDVSAKDKTYKLWFGKHKGTSVFDIEDQNYLVFLSETQRKTNKKLVGQVLLRIDELYGH